MQKRLEKITETNNAEIKSLNKIIPELRQELFQKDIYLKDALTKQESLQKEVLSLRKSELVIKSKVRNKALHAG